MSKSSRISTTLPASVLKQLESEASYQGRSVSNLVAYIIESHLKQLNQTSN